jgi:hypothetical protein
MRFNPPPNWPSPPPGWTPPPGWQPDPSWPPPPPGWILWVNAEDTVFMPWSKQLPWHKRTVTITLVLIFFFPAGLVLLWLRQDWSVRRRGIITGVVAVWAIFVIASSNSSPPTTIQVSPAAGHILSSPRPASTTSARSAETPAPSPASSSPSRPPASPVAVRTTQLAAAPVHTVAAPAPAAPAPTTAAPQAPQPVQTTVQPQQGCYPLTDAGNCYEPGEYCRDDDHGMTGIDGNGDPIVCEDNDGWRWERD